MYILLRASEKLNNFIKILIVIVLQTRRLTHYKIFLPMDGALKKI